MSPSFRSVARDVVTPVTAVTFVVSTVTGIMLLAHWNAGLVRFSHEWLSVAFAAVALWHLARNWRPFVLYLRRHAALAAIALSLAVCVAVTAMTGTAGGGGGPGAVYRALDAAPLSAAAPAFGLTPDAAVVLLRARGIDAATTETLGAIGARAGVGTPGVVTVLVAPGP